MNARPPLAALTITGLLLLTGCGGAGTSSSATQRTPASTTSTTAPGPASSATSAAPAPAAIGFEGVPLEQGPALAPAGTTQIKTVDRIRCGASEQLAYHIHAHLAVYARGALRSLPGGVGIPRSVPQQTPEGPVAAGGDCIYYLHTHTPDGVIHIESPVKRSYTLGEFFDEWHQPLSPTRVGTVGGSVTALLDGRRFTGNPRSIPLASHGVIQLDVGSPAPPQPVSWAQTQL
ncbi:MAG: hypothetical protein ACR2OB_11370 [Solirubrobacteraceae bacterium]